MTTELETLRPKMKKAIMGAIQFQRPFGERRESNGDWVTTAGLIEDMERICDLAAEAALEANPDTDGGYVRVLAKPTDTMIEAARMTLPGPVDICDADIEDIYMTMIEASPAPASKGPMEDV